MITTIKVTEAECDLFSEGVYSTEASALGLCPGYPPVALPTDIGNCKPFVLEDANNQVFHYKQPDTFIWLKIFNS
jgi:hypothetical protein